MSGILCTNPGSKKNSFIFKSCVIFLNTIEKYGKFFRSLISLQKCKKNSAIQNITACSERGSDKFFGNHIKYAFSEASFPMESLGLLK